MPETIQTKQCSKCKQIKPINKFSRMSRSKDGHNSWCKKCHSEYAKTKKRLTSMRKWSHSKHGKTVKRKYQQSKKGKEIQRNSDAKRLNHPTRKAKQAIMIMVRNGTIPRAKELKCAYCGNQARQYHHPDYNYPMVVIPVCIPCHKSIHSTYPISLGSGSFTSMVGAFR